LLHYLENATTYTSSEKLLNKSAMHADAVISLLLQSRKFWWCLLLVMSLTVFFDAAYDVIMTSYWRYSLFIGLQLQCLLI